MKYCFTVVIVLLACGCAHGQPAPSPNPVIGWTLSPGNGAQASWTQTLYVATIASLTSPCPTPGGTTYKQEGTATGTATSFSDANEVPGTIICAIDQESFVQGGQTFYSGYSTPSAPFQVPALPSTPGVPSPTVTTAMLAPQKIAPMHAPTLAKATPKPGAPRLRLIVAKS